MDYEKLHKKTLAALQQMVSEGKITEEIARSICADFVKESEDERIRKALLNEFIHLQSKGYKFAGLEGEEIITWLEKQGDVEYVFRPFAGCDIYSAAESAIERQKSGKKIILAFNGAYIPVDRKTADEIVNEYYSWLEKQGEKKLTIPIWKYKKDHTPLLRDSFILNKYGCVAKSPSGALVSDVWILDFDELAKLPKEEFEKQGEQNPAWSEEDEKMLDRLIKHFDWGSDYRFDKNDCDEAQDWLKSLKERMKGE